MSLRLKSLSEQVMVVAGASSGIGLATARRAARRGARVMLAARNGPVLREISADLAGEGCEVDHVVVDVGDAAAVMAAAQAAVDRFGRIDTWAHVAGVAIYAPLLETPAAEHERLFRTNYWGVVNAAQAAVPILARQGGAFVVVGSVVADLGTPILGAYAASKHAVKGYVDSLRIELLAARTPVSVTLIKPSGISSPLAEHAANHMDRAAKVPPPAYAPETVADAILHAAQHPQREIVVGGVGALQILGEKTASRLLDRVSGLIIPLLQDRRRPPPGGSNLWRAAADGRVTSPHERGRRLSTHTAATLHRPAALALGALGLGLLAAATLIGPARRSAPPTTPRRGPSAPRSSG
jgi:short-subunit dehydrogenase